MNSFELERLSDEDLVLIFAKAAKAHGTAMANGYKARAEAAYLDMEAVEDELRTRGLASRSRLLPLLDHQDPDIRYYAALWLLSIAPTSARQIIEEIANHRGGALAGDARGTLAALDKGTHWR